MKQTSRFLVVAAVALSTSLLGSTTFAQHGGFGGGGHGGGGGFHGGGGGFHGGYWGGGWGGGWGWRGYYPWGLSFYYAPSPYYYDPYYYYPPAYYPSTTYYAPPAVDSSQATYDYYSPPPDPKVIDIPQQPSVDRPLSPTAVDRDSPPPPPPSLAQPPPIQRGGQGQSISVADVKALAKAGLSDEVILSHIRNSQSMYRLTTAEIIDLKNSGVSEKIIDFMINTASARR
jgi:hypothetical protein